MIRITMIMLCLVMAAAAAGRYQAEVEVRETRREIQRLEQSKLQEVSDIKLLRAEIAYLESPERLSRIAKSVTNLAPLSGNQLLTADDFIVAFGDTDPIPVAVDVAAHSDEVLHAMAVADLGSVR